MNNINHGGDNNGDVDEFSNENIMDTLLLKILVHIQDPSQSLLRK
jgi:hypothetical protein